MYERLPFFVSSSYAVAWPAFILQTIFVSVGAAVLVNLRGLAKVSEIKHIYEVRPRKGGAVLT